MLKILCHVNGSRFITSLRIIYKNNDPWLLTCVPKPWTRDVDALCEKKILWQSILQDTFKYNLIRPYAKSEHIEKINNIYYDISVVYWSHNISIWLIWKLCKHHSCRDEGCMLISLHLYDLSEYLATLYAHLSPELLLRGLVISSHVTHLCLRDCPFTVARWTTCTIFTTLN